MTSNPIRFARLAVGTALAAALLSGCAGMPAARMSKAAAQPASKIERAVAVAEQAVTKRPTDAAARAALGRAYLKAGRFASAVDALDDAMELGDESPATVLGLALGEAAQGHHDAALQLLTDWRDVLPAADRGLALALAGETSAGVAVLAEALRAGDNSPQLRQNLAFAYALDGRWNEAKLMAAQDVPADQLEARIAAWALMGKPSDAQQRVASLLGAPLRADPGYPQALALGPTASATQMAAAAPIAPVKVELPAAKPAASAAPVAVAVAPQAAAAPAQLAQLERSKAAPAFVSQPVVQDVPAATPEAKGFVAPADLPRTALKAQDFTVSGEPARPGAPRLVGHYAGKPVAVAVAASTPKVPLKPKAAAAKPVKTAAAPEIKAVDGGSHWLQLGSYEDAEVAKSAWARFTARNPALAKFRPTITTATVNGKQYTRVSAAGFAGYADAAAMCRQVHGRGGQCLVVRVQPDAGAQMALARR